MELTTPAFVGREQPLAHLTSTLSQPPALVVVEGEAGIGKTWLVRQYLDAPPLRRQGSLVATCPPLREPFPLGPIVAALRQLRPPVHRLGLSPLAGALRPLFPDWADTLPPGLEPLPEPGATPYRLLAAVGELFNRLQVDVLVIEDAQWADASTLELLLVMLAGATGPGGLVVTYRSEDVPAASPLRQFTSRLPIHTSHARVVLEPLSSAESGRLVGSMLGTDKIPSALLRQLHDGTGGVPLALTETVRLLASRGQLTRRPDGSVAGIVAELQASPTVRDSVLERVARLPAAAQRLLEAAAVLDRPAKAARLARIARLTEPEAEAGLAAALRSGLLGEVGPGRFGFRHLLAARAIYAALAASDRHRLHERAVQALLTVDPPPVAQLARHLRQTGDVAAWSRYAEAAADVAMESGDDRGALLLLHELLTTTTHPPPRRARLARKLGEAVWFGVTAPDRLIGEAVSVLRQVREAGQLPARERGQIRLLLGLILFEQGEMAASFGEFEAALPYLGDQPAEAARAMMCLAMPLTTSWPAARHRQWLDRATDLLPHIPAGPGRVAFHTNRAKALLLLGDEAGWEAAARVTVASPGRYERWSAPRWSLSVAQEATVWGRYQEAHRHLATATERIAATGYHRRLAAALVARARLDWYTGRWAGLPGRLQQLVEAEQTAPLEQVEARTIQGLLALASGDRDGAEHTLSEVLEDLNRRGLLDPEGVSAAAALGRLYLADGAVPEAVAVITPVLEVIRQKGLWLWLTDLAPVAVEALLAAGRAGEAVMLVEGLAGWLGRLDAPAPAAALATCWAILPPPADVNQRRPCRFADALSACARLPRPYDELLVAERQGRYMLAAGDWDEAVILLREAERRLAQLGARWDADRIAQLLRQHGVKVGRPWRGGQRGYGVQLTPRQQEVVRLVANGLTNRQVADKLFLSPKTVTQHLSTAMQKLGVTSRTAVAMAAAEAGLLNHRDSE